MGYCKSILEYALVSLTIGIGGTTTYGSLKSSKHQINRSVINSKSGRRKYAVNIEYHTENRGSKQKFDVQERFEDIVTISEKITRDPLKIRYKEQSNKKRAIIKHVLEPNKEEGWKQEKVISGRSKANKKNYEIKIWKKSGSENECRFTWNWIKKKERQKEKIDFGSVLISDQYKNCKRDGIEIKEKQARKRKN